MVSGLHTKASKGDVKQSVPLPLVAMVDPPSPRRAQAEMDEELAWLYAQQERYSLAAQRRAGVLASWCRRHGVSGDILEQL